MPRTLDEPPPGKPAYFWWLLANALALCFAVASWFICLHIFGNPEIPRNYELLRKIGRLPELKRYTVLGEASLQVPNGTAMGPKDLYQKFFGTGDDKIVRVNTLLMRNYVTNFERPLLLTYIEGRYQIETVRPLNDTDFFDPGVVIRAHALIRPDEFTPEAPYPVAIEYVFPTTDPAAAKFFKPGDILEVKKSPNCAAVVHVAKARRDDEQVLLLTVIPIAYGKYQSGKESSFGIEPPTILRPAAGFPVIKD
ncbi:MAG TPA: hypothetical protein VM511_07985 [Luteolibacter sp.]|nr:hypothetical protein [Luteolibacter sp.]